MSTRFTLTRRYLRAHVWLHRQCDRLSPKWQKRIVFGLCIVYFACAAAMIVQLFLPQNEQSAAEQGLNKDVPQSSWCLWKFRSTYTVVRKHLVGMRTNTLYSSAPRRFPRF